MSPEESAVICLGYLKGSIWLKLNVEGMGKTRKNKGEHLRGSDQKDANETQELICGWRWSEILTMGSVDRFLRYQGSIGREAEAEIWTQELRVSTVWWMEMLGDSYIGKWAGVQESSVYRMCHFARLGAYIHGRA